MRLFLPFFNSITPKKLAKKSCYYCRVTDVFSNLALEDWFYKNYDFTNCPMLMLWRNKPCVVIGRHQNPWLECNFAELPIMGVELARRNSGGGTVYHDMENLNLTFFTSRADYNRKSNLELISRALKTHFNINSYMNKREDLCINEKKISGTASKLGRNTAYHHCTLLVNSNKNHISKALKNTLENVKTNATVSVKAEIMNLNEVCPNITVDKVLEALIKEYFNDEIQISDDDKELAVEVIDSIDEDHFPGIEEIKKLFQSSEWRFERTPKFTVYRNIRYSRDAAAFLIVEKGKIVNVGVEFGDVKLTVLEEDDDFRIFLEKNFSYEILKEFEHMEIKIYCNVENRIYPWRQLLPSSEYPSRYLMKM